MALVGVFAARLNDGRRTVTSGSRFFAAAGDDSVQALVLALRAADLTLATGFRKLRVEWLGDTERPIVFHTHVIEMYQGAIDNLVAAPRQAIKLVRGQP